MEYTEIFKLKTLLEKADVPFKFVDNSVTFKNKKYGTFRHYRIYVPSFSRQFMSAIQGDGSSGGAKNLLEITGVFTSWEREKNEHVFGFLTAEQVFEKIQRYYLVQGKSEKKHSTQKFLN